MVTSTRLFLLFTGQPKAGDIFLWKFATEWDVGKGPVKYHMLRCLMKCRFKCNCELKMCRSPEFVSLEMCGQHDENSHAPKKNRSKNLKVAKIDAIRQGVHMAPTQSAKNIRCHLENAVLIHLSTQPFKQVLGARSKNSGLIFWQGITPRGSVWESSRI